MASSLASDAPPGIMQVTQHRDREVATSHPVPHPEIFSLRKHLQMSVPAISQGIPRSSGGAILLWSLHPASARGQPGQWGELARRLLRVPWATEQTPPQGGTVLLKFRTLRAQSRLTLLSLSRMHGRPYATQCCLFPPY